MSTLDAELSRLSQDTSCLATGSDHVTVGELRVRAASIRKQMPMVCGLSIALCGLSPASLIETLVAFDGFASQIFLLPARIDHDTQQKLIESAQSAYALKESEGLAPTKVEASCSDLHDSPTRWILATSGTTGVPKLISHTLTSLTRTMKRDTRRGSTYTWGLMYDPCRFAGLQVVLQALIGGSCLALPLSVAFEALVDTLLEQKVNALSATPSLWRKLLMDGRVLGLPIKQITLGGETVDQPLLDGLHKRFPEARIVHIYASTEAGAAFAVQDGRAGFPSAWLGGISAPVPLRVGCDGQLLIKPAEMPAGDEILSRLDVDGFLDTQDLVRLDGDRVHFLGRVSGAINVGGNKVHPEEVENVIREISNVFDVRVFAKSNSIMGQLVAAEVVADAGVDTKLLRQQIQQHCRSKLEPWQCPALVMLVNDLQETAAGKRKRMS